MTISAKLTDVNNVKLDIKQALIDQGITMTGVPFTDYADKIGEIEGGGGIPEVVNDTWERPLWWPQPPIDIANTDKSVFGLFAIYPGQTLAFAAGGSNLSTSPANTHKVFRIFQNGPTQESTLTQTSGSFQNLFSATNITYDSITSSDQHPVSINHTTHTIERTNHLRREGEEISLYNISTTNLNNQLVGFKYFVINKTDNNFQITTKLNDQSAIVSFVESGTADLLPYKMFTVYSYFQTPAATTSGTVPLLGGGVALRNALELILNGSVLVDQAGSESSSAGDSSINFELIHYHAYKAGNLPVFQNNRRLKKITIVNLPTINTGNNANTFANLVELVDFSFPAGLVLNVATQGMFNKATKLKVIDLSNCVITGTNWSEAFRYANNLEKIIFPTLTNNITSHSNFCQPCYKITSLSQLVNFDFARLASPTVHSCFDYDTLKDVSAWTTFNTPPNLTQPRIEKFPTTIQVNTVNMAFYLPRHNNVALGYLEYIPAWNIQNCTSFGQLGGSSTGTAHPIRRCDLRNINVTTLNLRYCQLSGVEQNRVFSNLMPTVTTKTIDVRNNLDTIGRDITIATSKGWTVTV